MTVLPMRSVARKALPMSQALAFHWGVHVTARRVRMTAMRGIVMVDKVDFQSFRVEVGDLLVMIVLDLPLVRLFMV